MSSYDSWKLMSPDDERDAREEGLRGQCDCCGKRRPLSQCWIPGVESIPERERWLCEQCQGQDPDEAYDRRRDDANWKD